MKKKECSDNFRETEYFDIGNSNTDDLEKAYSARTYMGIIKKHQYEHDKNITGKEKKFTYEFICDRACVNIDSFKKSMLSKDNSEHRVLKRDDIIKIALSLELDKKDAYRLLESDPVKASRLVKTDRRDSIILKYYDSIIENFKNHPDVIWTENEGVKMMNSELNSVERGDYI